MLGRFVVGSCATIVAGLLILLGALGSTSEARALIMFAWFVGFASISWTLLPAFRFGKATAIAAGIAWLGCGVGAANFGVSSVRGYPLSSWMVASIVLVAFIVLRPAEDRAARGSSSDNGNEQDDSAPL